MKTELIQLKEKVVNQALVAFSIIGAFVQAFVAIRAFTYGLDIYFFLQTFWVFLLFAITIFRKKIRLNIKLLFFMLIIFFVMAFGLKAVGFLASSKVYVAIVPVFISFILKYKNALLSLAVYFSLYFAFAFLYSSGTIEYSIDPTAYANNIVSWLVDSCVLMLTAWGLLYVGNSFSSTLVLSNQKIQKQNIELSDKEEKFRKLFEEASDAIMLLLPNGRFFDCNNTACEYFKLSKEEILNKIPTELSPDLQSDNSRSTNKAKHYISSALDNQPQKFEWVHLDKDKNPFNVSISLNKIELSGVTYIQAILRDITEKKKNEKELDEYRNKLENIVEKRTEQLTKANQELETTLGSLKETQNQLVQAEKMASLGTLTAGVAHEINNPLNYIMGAYVGLSNYFEEFASNDEQKTSLFLNSIKTGIDRTANIVRGLNQFSRDNSKYDEDCDIHSIIDNCLVILHNQRKDKIGIIKQYCCEQTIIKGNVGKLHQVLINVLTNAIQSIDEKGIIKISTQKENEEIILTISDNGCGIAKEHIKQIINPFFTTKPPGEGTGLGLSISYSILKEHNASIEFKSEIKKGTDVTIRIPTKSKHHE